MQRLIPFSALWDYPGVAPMAVVKEFKFETYLRYITININLMGQHAFRPEFDLAYTQKLLRDFQSQSAEMDPEASWMNKTRITFTELLLALSRNNLDRVEDYAYLLVDIVVHRQCYGLMESIKLLIKILNHFKSIGRDVHDVRVKNILDHFLNLLSQWKFSLNDGQTIHYNYFERVLKCADVLSDWLPYNEHIDITKNLYRRVMQYYIDHCTVSIDSTGPAFGYMHRFIETAISILGQEGVTLLCNIHANATDKNNYSHFTVAILHAFNQHPEYTYQVETKSDNKEWLSNPANLSELHKEVVDLRSDTLTLADLVPRFDYAKTNEKFNFGDKKHRCYGFTYLDKMHTYLLHHHLHRVEFLKEVIDIVITYQHSAYQESAHFEARNALIEALRGGYTYGPYSKFHVAVSQLDIQYKYKLLSIETHSQHSNEVMIAMLQGLNYVEARHFCVLMLESGRLDASMKHALASLVMGPGAAINLLRNYDRSAAHASIVDLLVAPRLTLEEKKVAETASLANVTKEDILVLQQLPFALAVSLLNRSTEVPADVSRFLTRFQRANEHAGERHAIDYSVFMMNHLYELVNLHEALGNPLITLMADQLTTSALWLNRFLDSYQLIQRVHFVYLQRMIERYQMRDGRSFAEAIMLVSHLDTLAIELAEKQLPEDTADLPIEAIQQQLLEKTMTFYRKVLKLPDGMNVNTKIFEQYPALLSGLLTGRNNLRSNNFVNVLDAMVTEDLRAESGIRDFLYNTEQTNVLGKAIATHNAKVRSVLTSNHIEADLAINYPVTEKFTTATAETLKTENICQAIYLDLESILEHSTNKSVSNSITNIKKQIERFGAGPNVNLFMSSKFAGHFAELSKQLAKHIQSGKASDKFLEHTQHFLARVKQLEALQGMRGSEFFKSGNAKPKTFTLMQGNKFSANCFLTGNYVSCCLATDGTQFHAMVQRRLDAAMMWNVVIDDDLQEPISCIWLFLAYDVDLPQDIYVVGNFVEMRAGYSAKPHLRELICDKLIAFTAQYAEDIGAKGFLLRPLTHGMIPDFGKWPESEKHFTKTTINVDKLGEYFDPRTGSDNPEAKNLYYLDSLRLSEFYLHRTAMELSPAMTKR